MTKPAGNFDCSALQEIQVEIDRQWGDAQANTVDMIAEVDALVAIKNNQNVRFADLEGKQEKDNVVKIWWLADCATDVPENCDDRCDLGGPEPETDCKQYEITNCTKRGFSIPHNKLRTNKLNRSQLMAYNILRKMKQIEEEITQDVVAALYAFKGVNQSTIKPGVVSGSDTYVSAAYWDANLMGYLYQIAIQNRMRNSYLLSGQNLFQQKWQIENQTTNPTGASDAKKLSSIPLISDLFNIDSVIGTPATLMVNRNAVAFLSTNRYDSNPIQIGTKFFSSIASKRIPGLVFDMGAETVCDTDDFVDNVSLWATWDFVQNPLPCNPDMTGVLSFLCGEP